jgi:uncharacterized membrane protein
MQVMTSMNALKVYKYDSPDGAQNTLNNIYRLLNKELRTFYDAAVVSWPAGRNTPKTKQAVNLSGAETLDITFWGMLFGILFFVPYFGSNIGDSIFTLSSKLADYGISENFLKKVREEVVPGTSALFLIAEQTIFEQIIDQLNGHNFVLTTSYLSKDQEDRLLVKFAN